MFFQNAIVHSYCFSALFYSCGIFIKEKLQFNTSRGDKTAFKLQFFSQPAKGVRENQLTNKKTISILLCCLIDDENVWEKQQNTSFKSVYFMLFHLHHTFLKYGIKFNCHSVCFLFANKQGVNRCYIRVHANMKYAFFLSSCCSTMDHIGRSTGISNPA